MSDDNILAKDIAAGVELPSAATQHPPQRPKLRLSLTKLGPGTKVILLTHSELLN
jgi:hypothetical protein